MLGPQELMIVTLILTAVVMMGGMVVWVMVLFRRVEQGQALVVTTPSRTFVTFNGALLIPKLYSAAVVDISMKTIELERAVVTADHASVNVTATFHVRVNPTEEDVRKVAEALGSARASDESALSELFRPRFSEAIEVIVHHFTVDELFASRDVVCSKILSYIGEDLDGFVVDDLALQIEKPPAGSW